MWRLINSISIGKKITPNVRRILGFQRTFKHYLDDEEALLAQGGAPVAPAGPSRARKEIPMHPPPRPQTPKTTALKRERTSTDLPSTPVPTTSSTSEQRTSIGGAVSLLPTNPDLDNDPLLKSHTPKFPSARVMEALLSEPPLSYTAARAKSSDDGKPVRHFCATCGYWGKVKCRKCGERTCGLMECWKAHEGGCAPY